MPSFTERCIPNINIDDVRQLGRRVIRVLDSYRPQRSPIVTTHLAVAAGAFALGAVAIGALAIGFLSINRARIRRLEVDELVVGRLHIRERARD